MEKLRELLRHLEGATDHNVAGNGKRDGLKTVHYKTISSQATWKQAEGSTSRPWSLSPKGYDGKGPRARRMLSQAVLASIMMYSSLIRENKKGKA